MADTGEETGEVTAEDLAKLRAELSERIQALEKNDPLQKASDFADKMADREIAMLNRSYKRFFQLLSLFGGLVAVLVSVIVALIGWGVFEGIRSQVAQIANNQIPKIVEKQVVEQVDRSFKPDHVKQIADDQIRLEAGNQIKALVDAEVRISLSASVGKAVNRAVTDQYPEIEKEIRAGFSLFLTNKQKEYLEPVIQRLGPQNIRIDATPASEDYTGTLGQVFHDAGWNVQPDNHSENVPLNTGGMYTAELWVNSDPHHPFTDQQVRELTHALGYIGLKTQFKGRNSGTFAYAGPPCLTLVIWETKVP